MDGLGQIPETLSLALDCQAFSALPLVGGILDQPAGLVKRMRSYLNIYNALTAWKNHRQGAEADFVKNNPAAWRIVKEYIHG